MIDVLQLMIGDRVYNSYHKKNIRWSYGEMFCPNGNPVTGKDLQPIPLTAEILENNGFSFCKSSEHDNIREGWMIHDKCELSVVDGKYYQYMYDCDIPVNYVHELQRVLRCCDLWDLANNLKVE